MPVLLLIAGLTFFFGQDHPAGRWEERHILLVNTPYLEEADQKTFENDRENKKLGVHANPTIDDAIEGPPTLETYFRILISPSTWLPPFSYMTSFGLELAIDGNLGNVLFSLFNKKRPSFGQTRAGYYTSIL